MQESVVAMNAEEGENAREQRKIERVDAKNVLAEDRAADY